MCVCTCGVHVVVRVVCVRACVCVVACVCVWLHVRVLLVYSIYYKFVCFIQDILDYLEYLDVGQIRKVYSILSMLAYTINEESDSSLHDELQIIIRKQLHHADETYVQFCTITVKPVSL